MKKLTLLVLSLALTLVSLSAQALINRPDSPIQLSVQAEAGVTKILYHTYKVGATGTNFDFVNQGGQEILFPFDRYLVNLDLWKHHRVSFLYQPLTLDTQVRTRDPITVDGQLFPADTALNLSYGFPFWRLTYAYGFDLGPVQLGAGLALQLRNASIKFTAQDGSVSSVGQNLGPVPAINLYADWQIAKGFSLYAEATGLWASSSIINGANFEFEGSLLDVSLRPTLALREGLEAFVNLRFLGGSAKGTSNYPSTQWSTNEERYTENYLAAMSLTLGLTIR